MQTQASFAYSSSRLPHTPINRDLRRVKTCVNSYTSSCLRGLSRTASVLLVRGAAKEVDRICSESGNRTDLMRHTPCLNHHKKRLDECMTDYMLRVSLLSKVHAGDKIPGACCTFYSFCECVDRVIPSSGTQKCPQATRHYISLMMQSLASDVVSLLCRRTPKDAPICSSVPPPSTSSSPDSKSLLLPFVRAFESFSPA